MGRREVIIPYAPRLAFQPFHARQSRWAVIVAHRRAGKTVACINDVIKRAIEDGKQDGRYAYIAPFYSQAKGVAWDYLLHFSAPIRKQANASELWVELVTGARVRLFGADNAEALRGLYFDGIVADEYADWKPGVFGSVIRPALSDRKGWAVFIGTPKGHNAFWELFDRATEPEWFRLALRASETGILDSVELADAQKSMTADQYAQEYECSFEAAIVGAIYAKELQALREASRISAVPHDPAIPVHTAWDLGVGDSTTIIFWQQHGLSVRVIDAYEASGEGLPHYAQILQSKGYTYGKHWAPHDIQVRELGSGRSRIETAASLGIRFEVVPQMALEDGIHAARLLLPRCWFDDRKTRDLMEALQHYRWDLNQKTGELKPRPVHDWASHYADAFRYMAVALRDVAEKRSLVTVATHVSGWM